LSATFFIFNKFSIFPLKSVFKGKGEYQPLIHQLLKALCFSWLGQNWPDGYALSNADFVLEIYMAMMYFLLHLCTKMETAQ